MDQNNTQSELGWKKLIKRRQKGMKRNNTRGYLIRFYNRSRHIRFAGGRTKHDLIDFEALGHLADCPGWELKNTESFITKRFKENLNVL